MEAPVTCIEVGEDEFPERVLAESHRRPVVVDFWASWCAPCRALGPLLEGLARAYKGAFLLAKVDTERAPRLAAEYAVRSIPAVKLLRDGSVVDEFVGALPEGRIRAFLERHVPRPSDRGREQARRLLADGEPAQAVAVLEALRAEDPDNPRIAPELAAAQLAAGRLAEAAATLDSLPAAQADDPAVVALRARLELARVAAEAGEPAALEEALARDPGDCAARHRRAARRALAGDPDAAAEDLLEILRLDRDWNGGAARRSLLALLTLLGERDPRAGRYRARLASLLH